MHVGIHCLHTVYGDVSWKNSVESVCQLCRIQPINSLKMGCHHTSMHTCISSASTYHCGLPPKQRSQSTLQLFLYGVAIGLQLPSMIGSTIKLEVYEISLHFLLFQEFGCKGTQSRVQCKENFSISSALPDNNRISLSTSNA